jgi:hypothetical protein
MKVKMERGMQKMEMQMKRGMKMVATASTMTPWKTTLAADKRETVAVTGAICR